MRDYRETSNKITAVSLSYDFFVRALEVITSPPAAITKHTTVLVLPRLLKKKKRENEIPRVKEIGARANLLSIRVNHL